MALPNAWIRRRQEGNPLNPPPAATEETGEEETTSDTIPTPTIRVNVNAEDLTPTNITPLPGVGRATAVRILRAKEGGPFKDFEDFIERANIKLGEIELETLRDKVRFE